LKKFTTCDNGQRRMLNDEKARTTLWTRLANMELLTYVVQPSYME